MNLPYADEMPYWKTSKAGVETWLDKTEALIEKIGGEVITRIAGKSQGKEAIMFHFQIEEDSFKLLWPVLPVKKPEDRTAALRQTATMIYHDSKARVNRLAIFGARVVFADWLISANGKTFAEIPSHDLQKLLTK